MKNQMPREVHVYSESHNKDSKEVAFRFLTLSLVLILLLACFFEIATNIWVMFTVSMALSCRLSDFHFTLR